MSHPDISLNSCFCFYARIIGFEGKAIMSTDRSDSQNTEYVQLSLRSMDKLRRQYLQTLMGSHEPESTSEKFDLRELKTPVPEKTTDIRLQITGAMSQGRSRNPFIQAKHPGRRGIETTKFKDEAGGSSSEQPTNRRTFCKSTDCSDQGVRNLLAAKQQQTCIQSVSLVFDVAQQIVEDTAACFTSNCSQLELPLHFDKALQILSYEVLIASEEGDLVYQPLLDLLHSNIYRTTLGQSQKRWSEIPLSVELRIALGEHPYKVFYFTFRFVALVLYCVKHQILRATKERVAVELLKKINAIELSSGSRGRNCPLDRIFQHCRKNRLQKKEECYCHRQQESSMPNSIASTAPLNKQLLSQSLPNLTGYNGIFTGDLGLINIWQILQILGSEQKTGCLTVVGRQKTKIFLEAGRVIHCYSSSENGEIAFFNILGEDKGKFIFEVKKSPQKSMDVEMEYLLLECARLIDEQQREL